MKSWFCFSLLTIALLGCQKNASTSGESPASEDSTAEGNVESETQAFEPDLYELDAEKLLAQTLPEEMLAEGWVRVFDGQSLQGLFVSGNADWRVTEGTLKVEKGDRSFLCTNFELPNFEILIDFRCDPETNSGIFLRTGPQPQNVKEQCIELNIAPPDNPFPTGSLVQRHKLEPQDLGDFDATQWHTYRIRLEDSSLRVELDSKQILALDDVQTTNRSGHIALQHNEGRIEFRNFLIRPIKAEVLATNEDWESDWELQVKDGDKLEASGESDGLKLRGGLGQLQSQADYSDFIAQVTYSLKTPDVNSGIFFRCIRDNMLDGYECQVNHAIEENDATRPADGGAGAIFRRQNARLVVGDGTTRTHLTLMAVGSHFSTWINGIQVAETVDTRAPNDNPRRGLKLAAGPISLQGHDPKTEVTYHSFRVERIALE